MGADNGQLPPKTPLDFLYMWVPHVPWAKAMSLDRNEIRWGKSWKSPNHMTLFSKDSCEDLLVIKTYLQPFQRNQCTLTCEYFVCIQVPEILAYFF